MITGSNPSFLHFYSNKRQVLGVHVHLEQHSRACFISTITLNTKNQVIGWRKKSFSDSHAIGQYLDSHTYPIVLLITGFGILTKITASSQSSKIDSINNNSDYLSTDTPVFDSKINSYIKQTSFEKICTEVSIDKSRLIGVHLGFGSTCFGLDKESEDQLSNSYIDISLQNKRVLIQKKEEFNFGQALHDEDFYSGFYAVTATCQYSLGLQFSPEIIENKTKYDSFIKSSFYLNTAIKTILAILLLTVLSNLYFRYTIPKKQLINKNIATQYNKKNIINQEYLAQRTLVPEKFNPLPYHLSKVVDTLAILVPPKVTINSLSLHPEDNTARGIADMFELTAANITGQTDDINALNEFLDVLNKQGFIEKTNLGNLQSYDDAMTFKISIWLNED